jgi:hypothetical protein
MPSPPTFVRDGITHMLLGYDARQLRLPMANWWPRGPKHMHVLNADAERPLTIDPILWTPLFEVSSQFNRPEDYATMGKFWADPKILQDTVARQDPKGEWAHKIIALTIEIGSCPGVESLFEWESSYERLPNPEILDDEWRLLGSDVANPGFYSGLCSTGFHLEDEDVHTLMETWGPKLNESHLFSDLENAREYIQLATRREKQRAPFFVFGVWER